MEPARRAAEQTFRAEHGRVFAALVRQFGDFDAAADALQDAFRVALEVWPERGLPVRPGAWLLTVARNRILAELRHESVATRKQSLLAALAEAESGDGEDIPDERLRLICTCCHPALAEDARVALTLQAVCGLPTPTIARLFLVSEATVAQRLVRAKRRLRAAGIPFAVPSAELLEERLSAVLAVVYLLFTAGHHARGGEDVRAELCDEAIRLGRVVHHFVPGHAEAAGLLALMLLHAARRGARFTAGGDAVPLDEQDRGRWDRAAIREGVSLLESALARGARGPYSIQAAIAALHAEAPRATETDWPQIAALYRVLWPLQPAPAVGLSLALAEGMAQGLEAGLARLAALAREGLALEPGPLAATRAELLRHAGRQAEARAAYDAALAATDDPHQRRFLARRAAACAP